ncbi:ABC transporter substrate-binding protein [Promicromonospora sukumoe]|uniref:ABC transporter substrate-binding protein n=1 Tax=Promicromonospora sukumoe TaxID=88382 RepID=UPI0037C850EE
MTPDLTRRQLLGVTLAGLAAASLAACGPKGSPPGKPGLSWYGGDPVHEAMQELVRLYGTKHPDVDVVAQFSAFDDYWDRLATQTAGRSAPDVMRMSMSYLADYADRGALTDLSPYLGTSGTSGTKIDIDDMAPDIADSARIDGTYYGVSQSSIANAAFVNRDLVAALGVPDVDESWTWADFGTWAKEVGAARDDVYGSMDQGGSLQLFESYVREHGTEMFTPDGSNLAFDQGVLEEWWAYWHDLRAHRGAPPAAVSAEVAGFDTWPLAKGTTPVGFGWVQQVAFVQPFLDGPLDILTPPTAGTGTSGLFVKCLDFWSIASTSSQPDEAARIIDFLVNDDDAIRTLGIVLGVPPSQRAIDLLDLEAGSAEQRAVDYVGRVADVVPPAPPAWPLGYNELLSLFTKLGQDIGFGEAGVSDAATEFFEQSARVLR